MNMERQKLEESWARTHTHLENAAAKLPASLMQGGESGSLIVYRDYLDNNELELALDVLEVLGDSNNAVANFWENMLLAATEMLLDNHMKRYRERLNN